MNSKKSRTNSPLYNMYSLSRWVNPSYHNNSPRMQEVDCSRWVCLTDKTPTRVEEQMVQIEYSSCSFETLTNSKSISRRNPIKPNWLLNIKKSMKILGPSCSKNSRLLTLCLPGTRLPWSNKIYSWVLGRQILLILAFQIQSLMLILNHLNKLLTLTLRLSNQPCKS